MDKNRSIIEVFFDVQRGLPRQGPGCKASTLMAFKHCAQLSDNPTVLDIGCGPGMQTMVLAEACSGRIIAVDTCEEYLSELTQRVRLANIADRVEVAKADMTALDLRDQSVDLIWCEGAIYIMGISAALESWQPFLRHQGYLAFSELVWLEENPPEPVAKFWRREYPLMSNVSAIKEKICVAGYEVVSDFTLPDSAWWDDYYSPLEAKLPSLRRKYQANKEAMTIIDSTETEIDMRRRFWRSYGYQFFVLRNLR